MQTTFTVRCVACGARYDQTSERPPTVCGACGAAGRLSVVPGPWAPGFVTRPATGVSLPADAGQAERLRAAAVLVADVVAELNNRGARCAHCGRWAPEDAVEHKAFDALTQVREKLLGWADTLYLPPDQREDSPAARRARAKRERRHG